jgi:CheY-like chemotaxis protein
MSRFTILVAEDESLVREMLEDALQNDGYEVLTAEDGQQAQRVLEKQPVDVVVTDLIMPERDGLELLIMVRDSYPKIPVIVITAPSNNVYLPAAKRLGAAYCFEKPLVLSTFLASIQALLEDPITPATQSR